MATLLIVDDEADVREFASNFFRRHKITVLTASSGKEALDVLEKQIPNLVLLDIKMEGMDGIETLRHIKEKNPELKVMMVTGKEPEKEKSFDKCREYGAYSYIHKPLELDDLERIVLKELSHEN
ncbi:MAG: response regulator [Candidatus Omnitrophota bacterium]